ncbi:glutathione S-transferase [Syncephalis pseudoplumigaleata]|uniref:Glutathione S-transferase n=1 Tax=Syncephalis pseudoplumigaleata TaxID=1712513 RepID=A0A4P9Z3S7_9FUNG|nr:glutathione S-transferase [Syncephalis pseudoplumigaleata]|eukprot:RKP27085.1 glutathione S-transferase [Syncephalis pseudoplumigaleata]
MSSSTPVITYFQLDFEGRAGAIYLLLSDAGVAYRRVDVPRSDWPTLQKQLIANDASPNGTLPIMELDGRTYVHQLPILRVLVRHLGKYGGNDEDEAYEIDSFADLVADYHSAWSRAHWSDDDSIKTYYRDESRPRLLAGIDRFLARRKGGPYLLGDTPSYADFMLLAVLLDDKPPALEGYPHLKAFSEAMRQRPGIVRYLTTRPAE